MTTHNQFGQEYVKLAELSVGDVIYADGDFTCMIEGAHEVKAGDTARLCVDCEEGSHYLEGQDDGDGYLVGFTKEPGLT